MTGLTGSRQCAVIERCQKKIRDANLSLISTGRLYIVGMLRGDDSFVSSYNYIHSINNYSIYLFIAIKSRKCNGLLTEIEEY